MFYAYILLDYLLLKRWPSFSRAISIFFLPGVIKGHEKKYFNISLFSENKCPKPDVVKYTLYR